MNTRRIRERLFPLAATIVLLAVAPAAAAQQAAAPAPAAAGPAPASTPSWVKTCDTDKASKKELCIVTQEIRADSGTFIASLAVRQITGDKKFSMLATVPLGMLLKPGLKVQVDGGTPISLLYGICDIHACYGIGDVDDGFIDNMKSGKAVVLTTYSQQAKAVTFPLPLSGFAGALAGKGMDVAAFQKFEEQRANEFKARAEQAREALIKQQQQQQITGSPAPAQ